MTLSAVEQEAYETVKGLINTLSDKFKLQPNEKILRLQYSKLIKAFT